MVAAERPPYFPRHARQGLASGVRRATIEASLAQAEGRSCPDVVHSTRTYWLLHGNQSERPSILPRSRSRCSLVYPTLALGQKVEVPSAMGQFANCGASDRCPGAELQADQDRRGLRCKGAWLVLRNYRPTLFALL